MSEQDDPGGAPSRVQIADEQSRPVDTASLERVATRALDEAGIPDGHTLSIALVSVERITDLKGRFYGEPKATDVLSFPMDPLEAPAPAMLGDVVICVDVAAEQAAALGRTGQEEIEYLLVHGVLHLAGRDHETPADEVAMAREERRILHAKAVAS